MGLPVPGWLDGMHNPLAFAFTQFLLTLPILYLNRNYFFTGFKTLWHRSPNMDSLIAVGSSAAMIYGIYIIYQISFAFVAGDHAALMAYSMDLYFEGAGTILTLITLGKWLEARSKGKTSRGHHQADGPGPQDRHRGAGRRGGGDPGGGGRAPGILWSIRPGREHSGGRRDAGGAAPRWTNRAITGESIPVEKTVGRHG